MECFLRDDACVRSHFLQLNMSQGKSNCCSGPQATEQDQRPWSKGRTPTVFTAAATSESPVHCLRVFPARLHSPVFYHRSGDHVLGDLNTVSALLREPETEWYRLSCFACQHEFRSLHTNSASVD
ncbi:uncharacterized protein LOC110830035 isoform X5 [Zootermopsis nevadensis]|uniref:uncharacterized protein LOC110830035 isoform X5 n=1 Tax=Zootermopsis nevadensis TaxID=136037 RepID=UPI000B8EB2A0|nr:uncharacterized protein LOC110830035 isoform X5 [Zootermopsis nevadensis]